MIDAADESSIDGKAIDLRSVRPRIEQLRAADPESGVVLVADEGASTGILAAVVDQIHLGGVSDITFTTTKLAAAPGER